MHIDGHDPQQTPTEQQMDDGQDVVPGPVPAPVPITIGGHHQVLKENIQVVPGPVPAPVPVTIDGHHQVLRENIQDAILLWLLSVAKLVLKILTSPITIALASSLLVIVTTYTSSFAVSRIIDGLGPLCTIPILSTVSMCVPISNATTPFPKLVEQQIRFVSVMDSASLNSNLALDLMHMEMAVKDLNAEIKLSNVESKDELIRVFNNIAALANEANQQLITLQSGVGNAVESILAMNEWGVGALKAIEVHDGRSFISGAIFPFRSPPIGRDEIIETFGAIADLMESKLHNLIRMAQLTVTTLSTLKDDFGTVREIQLRAVETTQFQRDRAFATMWTWIEEIWGKPGTSTKNMDLLSEVEKYRSTATLTVGNTLMQLVELRADLMNLRSEVKSRSSRQKAKPQLELLIMTLRNGAQRLSEARAMARSKDAQSRKRMFYGAQVPELESSAA